jgi:type I restriction enzyme S subunit
MVQYMENPGYPSLKLSAISKISIPLPSLDIQQHLAAELKEKMAQVEKLRTSIEKQLEAINALPQAILIKAFRGEL